MEIVWELLFLFFLEICLDETPSTVYAIHVFMILNLFSNKNMDCSLSFS